MTSVYNYSSPQSQNRQISLENKRSLKQSPRFKKIYIYENAYVSFDIVFDEIPQFFQFPKRDISTARCMCTIYIFTFKDINVVMITEFINMTVLLSM